MKNVKSKKYWNKTAFLQTIISTPIWLFPFFAVIPFSGDGVWVLISLVIIFTPVNYFLLKWDIDDPMWL